MNKNQTARNPLQTHKAMTQVMVMTLINMTSGRLGSFLSLIEKFVLLISFFMKLFTTSLLAVSAFTISLSSVKADTASPTADAGTFQCIATKVTIANKDVDSVVQWNTKTGEARLLNAASFADKATGQQGNLIGWVPLTDLQQAVQNLAQQIQAQQKTAPAAPTSTPIKPKQN
jgi:hypothetical protein